MGAIRVLSRTLVLCGAVLLLAASAQATPLGLSNGDKITSLAWDALKSVDGDGAEFNASLGTKGGILADGRITTVTLETSPPSLQQSNVALSFGLDLLSQSLSAGNLPWASGNAYFPGAAAVTPDFLVKENGVNILWGDFAGNVRIRGPINLADPSSQVLSGTGKVRITGGDAQLVAALGGTGSEALLALSAVLSDSAPKLNVLAADGNIYNSNFNFSLVGTLTPLNPSPFVPEPSTALLLGAGLLGLLAAGRRRIR